jgi:hypothetical protein
MHQKKPVREFFPDRLETGNQSIGREKSTTPK